MAEQGRTAWSRRSIVAGGIGATLFLPTSAGAASRQTPTASPVPITDRSAWLIARAELTAIQERPDLRIIAMMANDVFTKGHIPGATAIDWPALELGTTTDAAIAEWTGAMREVVASLGIEPASNVVLYDEGTLFAARLWWLMDYLGHDSKRILDGGLPAWQSINGSISLPTAATPSAAIGTVPWPPLRAEMLARLADVQAALGREDVVFVDARTPDEYAAGHLPGAVNVNYPLNAEPDVPRFWKSSELLHALYAAVGVTADKRIIPYCSTGVRSAVTWCALRMIGFPDVALFTGSWAEWSAHPELPVTTGAQP